MRFIINITKQSWIILNRTTTKTFKFCKNKKLIGVLIELCNIGHNIRNSPLKWFLLEDNDCAVEAHENAQDNSQQNAANHHQRLEKDGQASDRHTNCFKERTFAADEVVQQPLPASEEHVGALDQRDHRVEWYVHD